MIRFLFLGLLLPCLAFADTQEQTNAVVSSYGVNGKTGTSGQGACTALGSYTFTAGTAQPTTSGGYILYQTIVAGTCDYQGVAKATVYASYTCPPGATKDATNRCMYPTQCNPGETRQPDGSCKAEIPCPTYPPSTPDSLPLTQPANCQCPSGTQWYAGNGCRKTCDSGQPTGGLANAGFGIAIADGASEACFQGCLVQHQAGAYDRYKGYKVAPATWSKWACKGTGLGAAPTPDGNPEPDAQTQDPSKKKDPPCAAGEGVITSSSGGVKCLPEGTPNTSRPSVDEKKKTETFPDNTTKTTTEVTTRDPNTGASSVSVTTISTGGLSGPAGTTTSQSATNGNLGGGSGDNSGNEPGQCAKEPDSPMCKKGTVKEKGQFDSAQGAKLQEAKDQLTAKFNEIKSAASAAFTASTASGSGTLPCPAPITVLGKPVSLCVSDYANQLSVIGAIIVFAAGIIAILLVVTA